jgi:cardiolipin synthase
MKLLVQPGDSVAPLVKGIDGAKKSVEIVIFRFDRREIEQALKNAVERGVFVHALIAYTNRGGEQNLRKMETSFLEAGVTVARTADDLARYHGKFMIVDRRVLYLLAFNFTYLDIEHCRSFGVATRNRALVQEAIKLFEADTKRQPYSPGPGPLVVSPINARKQLTAFVKRAKKQLLIYDPRISDSAMVRQLRERAKAGVEIKIIGRLSRGGLMADVRRLTRLRLHTRTIIRDRHAVFLGSQSLRKLELDARREVGIIFRNREVTNRLIKIFEEDWSSATECKEPWVKEQKSAAIRAAKKVAKTIAKDLPPVAPAVEDAVKKVVGPDAIMKVDASKVEETVKNAVKQAVKEVIRDVVTEAAEQKDTDKSGKNG